MSSKTANAKKDRVPQLPKLLACAFILIYGLAAYANSFSGVFIFDDYDSIVKNPSIREIDNPSLLFKPDSSSTTFGRPVLNFSFALCHAINGVDSFYGSSPEFVGEK